METKINLLRQSVKYDSKLMSYRMALEITSTENIVKELFVKQRIRKPEINNFVDVFASVATPALLEELDNNSPGEGTSYFLSSAVDIVGATPEYLEDVFTSILSDLQRLAADVTVLNTTLEADGIYEITSDNIEVNIGMVHTHYRQTLIARPCGVNDTTTYPGNHYVGSQDTALTGWLNTVGGTDPANYYFKYNIATDVSLSSLMPIPADKLSLARLEVNGIVAAPGDVLITEDAIYWKNRSLGYAPWPQDWVNSGDPGDTENQIILVLDFVK